MDIELFANCIEAKTLAKSIGINCTFTEISPNLQLKRKETPSLFIERILQEEAAKIDVSNFLVSIKTVFVGRRLITTPQNENEAQTLYELYSGRNHCVLTGIAKQREDGKISIRKTLTRIKVKHITPLEVQQLIQSKEWSCLGGYQPHGVFSRFIANIVLHFYHRQIYCKFVVFYGQISAIYYVS